jgi:putative ABC transport system permease protein
VTAQIALALALTASAGLLLKSFARVTSVDAGFNADRVLLAQVSHTTERADPVRWATYVERGLANLRALPGVAVAGAGAPLPLSGQQGLLRFGAFVDRAASADATAGQAPAGPAGRAYLRWATPDYFRAMGIPLVDGRAFDGRDTPKSQPVAVVDRTFVDRYLGGDPPIGRKIRMSNERAFREIVGVVGAVRPTRLEEEPEPHVYLAQGQNPSPVITFAVRTHGDPRALASSVRAALTAIDPAQPVYNVRTLEEVVVGAAAARRFNALLLVLFASLAAGLTIVGIYGVMAFWVAESRRDFGVRLALGASRREIIAMVLRRGLRVTAWGAALGLGLAVAGGRWIAGLLFGVSPLDPEVLTMATALLCAAALAGSYIPARNAVKIEPAESLRTSS